MGTFVVAHWDSHPYLLKMREMRIMGLPEHKHKNELNDTWRKLLGLSAIDSMDTQADAHLPVTPTIVQSDPWSQLLHAQGVEMVDLQHLRLSPTQISLSDREVEQALQIMQEQPDHP